MKILFCALLLIASFTLVAQSEKIDQYLSQSDSSPVALNQIVNIEINKPVPSVTQSKVNRTVFGFLPDWVYTPTIINELRFDLLTHIAVTPFQADMNGNLTPPFAWPWNNIIQSSKSNNVKLIMTVANFNSGEIHLLLTDAVKRTKLIDNIKQTILFYGFSGVNIDFENIQETDQQFAVANFLSILKQTLFQVNADYEISFSSPVINFGKWDFKNIANSCDYIFIMAYDFYGSWSSTTGPSAPLTGLYYNITKIFDGNADYALVNPSKLILGVPYYGNYWNTKLKDSYTPVDTSASKREWVKSLYYNEIASVYSKYEKLNDSISGTPWIRWQDSQWNQIWYDDEVSIGLKYDLAVSKKLKGIGIWALGYDSGRKELWNLIEKKFSSVNDIAEEIIPGSFDLFQNYPNPFNPNTTIKYSIPAETFGPTTLQLVTLKVYDVLGIEIATLVNEYKPAGEYSVEFRVKSVEYSSGLYFYRLKAGNFVETKKMMFLK